MNGTGVLESFFGLLQLTWDKLEREHQLSNMIGIGSREFLPMAARQLGCYPRLHDILRGSVGRSLERAIAARSQ